MINNNASSYIKTSNIYVNIIANLPNLNSTENVWDYKKDLLVVKWKKLRGLGKSIPAKAQRETPQIWQSDVVLVKTKEICNGW